MAMKNISGSRFDNPARFDIDQTEFTGLIRRSHPPIPRLIEVAKDVSAVRKQRGMTAEAVSRRCTHLTFDIELTIEEQTTGRIVAIRHRKEPAFRQRHQTVTQPMIRQRNVPHLPGRKVQIDDIRELLPGVCPVQGGYRINMPAQLIRPYRKRNGRRTGADEARFEKLAAVELYHADNFGGGDNGIPYISSRNRSASSGLDSNDVG